MGACWWRRCWAASSWRSASFRRPLAKVAEQARRDPLTGLASRTCSTNDSNAMRLRKRNATLWSAMLAGPQRLQTRQRHASAHHAGDELLILVADRLAGCVRTGDNCRRLGGDEFVIIEDAADQSHQVADQNPERLRPTFTVDGHEMAILPSLGLAIAAPRNPTSPATNCSAEPTSRCTPRNGCARGIQTFTPKMGLAGMAGIDHDPLRRGTLRSAATSGADQLVMLGELQAAIAHSNSPCSTNRRPQHPQIVGAEALVRWAHRADSRAPKIPALVAAPPDEAVNDLVLNTALDDARRWHRLHQHPGRDQPPLTWPADLPATITRLADRDLNPATRPSRSPNNCSSRRPDAPAPSAATPPRRHAIALDDGRLLPSSAHRDQTRPQSRILTSQRAAAIVAAVIAFAHTTGPQSRRRRHQKTRHHRRPLRTYTCDWKFGGCRLAPVTPSTRRHVSHRPVGQTTRAPKTTHVAIAAAVSVRRFRHLVAQRLVARRRRRDRQRSRAGRIVPVGRGVRRNSGAIRVRPAGGRRGWR